MNGDSRARSLAEWFTLSLSVLVVGALIVVAVVEESRRQEGDLAAIEMTFDTERAVARGESYYVPYSISNTGAGAISSAEIWIEVYDRDELVESAEITVQFLPIEGRQDGVFVTTHNPASHTLQSRLESLQFP